MRKINWGVIGTAGIAQSQTIPGMQLAENCHLYAIAGRNPEKAAAFRTEFGFEKAYGSYLELLEDPAVEAVYIPLPNTLHYEWIKRSLEHGKHVLCEKPMVPTASQAMELFALARENHVFLMEAYAYLHSPFIRAIKDDLSGIGRIRYIESQFLTSDYSLSNIRMQKETNGGALYDLGCYNTSMISWMLGKQPETVQAVAAFSPEGVDTLTSAILTYDDGAKAMMTCGMVLETDAGHRIDQLRIEGSQGSIRTTGAFNGCGRMEYSVLLNGVETIKQIDVPQNYRLEVEQLGKCISGNEQPHVTEEFTLSNLQTIERILQVIGY